MSDLINASLSELSAALAAKQVSSVELSTLFLDRIEKLNPQINAFVTVDRARTLAQAAKPLMLDLHHATDRQIHLAVLDGVEVVYVEIVHGGLPLASSIGGRLPAHATGVGKALLAYSPQAVVAQRIEAGLEPMTPRTISTSAGLIRALQENRIAGAALDVFEREPEVPEALRVLENATLLPHLGTATEEVRTGMAMRAMENLVAFDEGRALRDRVN